MEDNRIQMSGGIAIGNLVDEACKYLVVLESDNIKMMEIKLKVMKDYYRKVKKVLNSSLNSGNTGKAINT